MEYKLTVAKIEGDQVTMTSSLGYTETLQVGDDITIEIPDDANVVEETDIQTEISYSDLKGMAEYHQARSADGDR